MSQTQKNTSLLSSDQQSNIYNGSQHHHDKHQQHHIEAGQYLKSLVYGGLDGAVNTLAVVLGGIASGATPASIVAFGVSVIVGDGIGMGLGDYLSAKAQKEFIQAQQKREEWEFDNKYDTQIAEVVQIFVEKGYQLEQTRRLVSLFATSKPAFINIMLLEQLGLVKDTSNPLINGIITLISFALFGFLPLIPYIIGYTFLHDNETQYLLPCLIIAGVLFFILGLAKGSLIRQGRLKSAIETLILGGIAVGAGYGIGMVFQG